MPHVFVSYVREDTEQVERLCEELAKHGVELWLDKNDIMPGARWKDAIRDAIQSGDYFIACFSDNYVTRSSRTKTFMNEELQLALDELRQYGPNRAWFIPVLISETAVPALSISARETLLDIQWVNLFQNWDAGIKAILNVIKPLPPEVSTLIYSLSSSDKSIRTYALEELYRIAESRTVSAIAPLMADEDKKIGERAVNIIGEIGDSSAVPELVKFIKSAKPDTRIAPPPENDRYDSYDRIKSMRYYKTVRAHATEALGNIGDKAATPFLLGALKDPEFYVRLAAAKALGQIGDPAALPTLISYLEDPDEDVCSNAAIALGGISDTTAVPALIELLRNRKRADENRLDAVRALGSIGDSAAVPALIERLRDPEINHDEISAVTEAFKNIGGAAALPSLFEDVSSTDPRICNRAVSTLGHIGDPRAIPVLIKALKDPAAVVHIHALGNALSAIVDQTAMPSLITALKDRHALVRRRAAYALTAICYKPFGRDYYSNVSSGYAAAESALMESLRDPDAGVRARSADALGQIRRECRFLRNSRNPLWDYSKPEPVFLALVKAYERESDKRVQSVLYHSLRNFDSFDEREIRHETLFRKPIDRNTKNIYTDPMVWESIP